MHEKEIIYFTEAIQEASQKFYLDAMSKFRIIIDEYPDSDLADDAMYNIGLCYYELNQFPKSIDTSKDLIKKYPEATITALENSSEFGKTAAKAYYLIIQCYLGMNNLDEAEHYFSFLKAYNDNSYISKNEKKYTFESLANKAIKTFKELTK